MTAKCEHCGEEFGDGDKAFAMGTIRGDGIGVAHIHAECLFRIVNGSAAHIEGRCSCFDVTSCEGDDPNLSRRQAAVAAREAYAAKYAWPNPRTKH